MNDKRETRNKRHAISAHRFALRLHRFFPSCPCFMLLYFDLERFSFECTMQENRTTADTADTVKVKNCVSVSLWLIVLIATVFLQGCVQHNRESQPESEIVVAAAASLTDAFNELGGRFTAKTGIRVTFSYGATGDLARQIESGAPFDVFASADEAHINKLIEKNLLQSESRAVFARGRLVLWWARDKNGFALPEEVAGASVKRIAIAKPDVAPYGRAAVESLKTLNVWEQVEPKVVYAQTVAQAKQFAATGNADAAFIPRALVKAGDGGFVEVDEDLHAPITHTIAVIVETKRARAARLFVEFVMSEEGQTLLEKYGYRKGAKQ